MSSHDLIKQLSKKLSDCLNQDRHSLKRELDRLRSDYQKGKIQESKLAVLAGRIDQSVGKKLKRQASIPTINFPDLPVSGKKDEIAQLIQQHQVVIVCGETGSGKTTQLPKICLSIGRGASGFIGHTQPRRIAARTVADRIAEELGEPLGKSVGYKVRFYDKTHAESLVKLMTDGILLAETQNDPYLNQYDTIIIDEAHERSLNIDFLLGYMRWLLPKRPDLKLIITSATIDPERFAKHYSGAPIVEVSGRTYPVDIRYRPIEQSEENDETTADLQQAILDAVDELARDMRGDILIFLSGEREIRETTESLRKHHPTGYEILPLYSKLSVSEQEQVFKPKGGLRIVLATNVAETSLTVPGIRCVIDTGHARISRYSHRSKIQRLPIEKISQASANQRAGRCGRVAEGICIRLYSKEDFIVRPEFTEPEILRTNLSSVILQMISLNLGDIEDFPFVEPPEDKMIRDGKTMLHEVNALDKQGRLTEMGKQIAKLPTDPKLARMLLAAAELNCLTEVSIIVSALSVQDPRDKPADKLPQAEAKHAIYKHPESDFLTLLNLWNAFEEQKKHLSNNKLRKYCKDQFLSYIRMKEWFDIHAQIMQVIKGELKLKPNMLEAGYSEIHRALLPGLLSNIGFKHEQYEYLGARGLKFFIFPGSGLHKLRPKWIMAAEHVETSKVYARTVAQIEPEWIEACSGHLIKRNYYDPHWEKKAGRSGIYERTLLYGLTLQAKRKIPYEHVDPKAARDFFIRFGLVNHEYQTNAPFFKANQQLLEEVGYIQHKGRRVDLIEDEEWLFQFYDKKIPESVVNGVTFEQWRKTVERENARFLFLTKEDLTREQDHLVNEWDFPDSKSVGRLTFNLQYRFEPGHDEDGVTAIIPVHQLNQISEQPFEWLVPGMLEEKVIGLIKSLPKQLRKHFVPVPQTAKHCLEIEPDFKGSLYEWLGTRLRKLTGEAIPLNEWHPEVLSDHLNMNYRIVDEQGKLLDFGRDLKKLQSQFSQKAGQTFDQLAADELNYTGCVQWAFDDLPETYQFIQQGQAFIGYPAIVDEGDSVGVKIFDTRQKADAIHHDGLVKLFQLYLAKECKYLLKNMPHSPALELLYQKLSPHLLLSNYAGRSFKDDILYCVFSSVFLDEGLIRSQLVFERRLDAHKSELVSVTNEASLLAKEVMERVVAISRQLQRLNASDPLGKDINEQLNLLVFAGFIRRTPYQQLKQFPRYLKAVEYRLEKMNNDVQKQQEINRFCQRYWKEVAERAKKKSVVPESDPFRWLLEEFRVSLYAQQLKTPFPISAKRLEKAWDERF
ncbi:MAG: ATP-dependent RNA helicase HrpA [Methylicorpusculum sp.]|uniref:ATP-dependent RNA helicase HrpA n=1 Tax=Methylicorpusculum sp. TaxID=2713644 RepID=UPI00271CF92B|nr:ATP-dependent RNA helicase HrpA [Methylicorpusculum sp.]MDO8937997.1 ATP-dependent RNA helicase HrpA [Methylicorpusculum sp.]MDP2202798.1 ATP-dependent RNA helicase HrpA [Methylicorpusculum sp.]